MSATRIDELLKAEWPSTKRQLEPASVRGPEDFVLWDCRLTPGFPAEWPFPRNGQLLYYAGPKPTNCRQAGCATTPSGRSSPLRKGKRVLSLLDREQRSRRW